MTQVNDWLLVEGQRQASYRHEKNDKDNSYARS